MSANIAAEGHDNDFLEEGDGRTAHFDESRVEAGGARLRERHELLPDVALLMLISCVVDRLAKIDHIRINFGFLLPISVSGSLAHRECLLPRLLVDRLHFSQQGFLLFSCSFRCLGLALTIFGFFLGLLFGLSLESVLIGESSSFIYIVAHSLIIFDCAIKSLMDAANIWIWRVWVLNKAIARWINDLEIEGEIAAFSQRLQPFNELIKLFSDLRVEFATFLLHLRDSFDRRQQEPLDRLDGAFLGLRWDLKIELGDSNRREFRLDH